jgi:hypothetical protein
MVQDGAGHADHHAEPEVPGSEHLLAEYVAQDDDTHGTYEDPLPLNTRSEIGHFESSFLE